MKCIFSFILVCYCCHPFCQVKTIYVDPASAISTTVSQVFSQVNYIPLETNRKSTISQISDMLVTDQYFIILDRSASAIFFFDRSGKFIDKYQDVKNNIRRMSLAAGSERLFIQTEKKGFSFTDKEKFDLATGLSKNDYFKLFECRLSNDSFRFREIRHFKYAGFYLAPLSADKFLISLDYVDKNSSGKKRHEMKLIENNTVTKQFFRYNPDKFSPFYHDLSHIAFAKSLQGEVVYFARPLHYSLYAYSQGAVSEKFKFIFPMSMSLPANYITSDLSTQANREYYRKEYQGAIDKILPEVYCDDYFLFSLNTLQPNNMLDRRRYFMEMNSNTLVYLYRISPDTLSYGLPVNLGWTLCGDNTGIYAYLSAYELLNAAKNIDLNPENLPDALMTFIRKNDAKSNPVIVQAKIK